MPVRLSSARLPFSLSIGGATIEKSGGATCDLEAGGTLVRRRKRKLVYSIPVRLPSRTPVFEEAPAIVYTKGGGAVAGLRASGLRRVEHWRSGSAVAAWQAGGVVVKRFADGEWIELVMAGVLTLDDLIEMGAPDWQIEEALTLS